MSEEYYGYQFHCTFGKKCTQSYENMQIVFSRTEIFEYLVHGHPLFQKPELIIENGLVQVDLNPYAMALGEFCEWICAILDVIEVTEPILLHGIPLGGSNYLEAKWRKVCSQEAESTPEIKSHMEDTRQGYEWKHAVITTAIHAHVNGVIQEKEAEGFTLIHYPEQRFVVPYVLTFRRAI